MSALSRSERRYWLRFVAALVVIYGCISGVAWLVSDSLIFVPRYGSRVDPEGASKITRGDGSQLAVAFLPNPDARYTLWYFHGNAEALGDIGARLRELRDLGFSIFAIDYPGYGTNVDPPTEFKSYEAVDLGLAYLRDELKVHPEDVVVYGRSVGGGPAVELASQQNVAGLILESTFVSAYRVMTRWRILPGDTFDNFEKWWA